METNIWYAEESGYNSYFSVRNLLNGNNRNTLSPRFITPYHHLLFMYILYPYLIWNSNDLQNIMSKDEFRILSFSNEICKLLITSLIKTVKAQGVLILQLIFPSSHRFAWNEKTTLFCIVSGQFDFCSELKSLDLSSSHMVTLIPLSHCISSKFYVYCWGYT